jgi:colanic acid/amylovoran biosynthesis glycosyltransferase
MRVAYFVNRFPLLSETFILGQITGMIDRGHEVRIFASGPAPQGVGHPLVDEYHLLDRTVFAATVPRRVLARLPRALSVLAEARRTGQLRAALSAVDVRRFGREGLGLGLLLQTAPFLGQPRFDILHCQFGDVGPMVLRLRQLGVLEGALVVSFRGWDTTQYPRLRPGRYDALFAQAAVCLPVSESLARRLVALGCPPERIRVLRSGIDLHRFRFRSATAAAQPAMLTTVGRLTEKKGIEFGIRAVRMLVDAGYSVRYRIAGDGPLDGALRRLVADLGLQNCVSFLGSLPSTEIVELLETSDVFLAPSVTGSRGNEEGIPNALKEAMAVGVPVVSTRHGGIPELVADGVSGLLVAERDAEGLAARVRRLLEDQALRAACVEAGRKVIEDDYEIDALNDRLESIYRQVAGPDAAGHDARHTGRL